MTEAVRTTVRPAGADLLDELSGEGSGSVSGVDIFERLWHVFISMRTGLVLIFAIALLTLVGTLLVQVPQGMLSDRAAYTAWLETLRPKYGGWTNVLDVLGFFNIFSSVLFRSLVALLSTSILACSVNRAPKLWKQAMHPRTMMSPGFYQHAALRSHLAVDVDPAAAQSVVAGELKRAGYRTVVHADEAGVDIYADKFRWGPFGTVFAHLSIILILVGAMAGAAGFRDQSFVVPVGSKVAVGNGTALAVQATSFSDTYYENGSPADYASTLVLYDGGQVVQEQTIRVNQPMRYGDVTFYQSFFGAAAAIQIRDAAGTVLIDQGVPLQYVSNDGKDSIGQLDLADQGLMVLLVVPASGRLDSTIKPGTLQLEVYKGAAQTMIGTQVVTPGKPVTIGDLSYTFVREQRFTGLIVARDPGAMFVWAGSFFLVFGVALVFFFPNRRIWARVRAAGDGAVIEAGALTRHDVMFEAAFSKLVNDVKLGLSGPAAV
jgi:cytochrome c biogenesis protein